MGDYNKNLAQRKAVYQIMRIAITGITGYFGGHLATALAHRGHTVTGIVRPTSFTEPLRGKFDLRVATLDGDPVLRAAFHNVDLVIHSAAKVHSLGAWPEFASSVIRATQHTLEAAIAAGVPRFVQMSTVGVYGFPKRPDAPPFTDDSPHGPIHRWNYYSRAKAEAEKLVFAAQQAGQISTTILRPTWMYGPQDTTVLSRIVEALRQHRFFWIGEGHNQLSIIYLSDAIDAVTRVVENPIANGHSYNIAADELAPTQHQFIARLCELLDLPLPTRHLPYPIAQVLGFAGEWVAHATAFRMRPPLTRLTAHLFGGLRRFNSNGLRKDLGWVPQVNFNDGIGRSVEWLRST